MKVLFLSRWFPYPADNGSKLRILNLLKGLAARHEVTLLSFYEQQDLERGREAIGRFCSKVLAVPWQGFRPCSVRALAGYLSNTPRSVRSTYSVAMEEMIRQTLHADRYDVVIASQIDMAAYRQVFRPVPALLEEIELSVPYEQFVAAPSLRLYLRHGLTWFKHRRYMSGVLTSFRACTVVTEKEHRLLAAIAPECPVEVLPNCVDLSAYENIPHHPHPGRLIFTGSFRFFANYDAMYWFLSDIYPFIRASVPQATVTITGDPAGRDLPHAANVTLTGFVDDIRPWIAESAVSIVPLRIGGGTRLKILEAMALGTPVVTTSKGAEGLAVHDGEHLLIADTPRSFAEATVHLLNNPEAGRQMARNALRRVSEQYDWAKIMPRFLALVERTANGLSVDCKQ